MSSNNIEEKKVLYPYQVSDLNAIFERIRSESENYHLLYQLPTGGGKTVIFSEITRRYIETFKKKVVILTHRVELCKQTTRMLSSFGVVNKVISSDVKELEYQDTFDCYVAMVETLKNRIFDEKILLENVGLVIVDEAHFNSFRKLFSSFKKSFILGVTATPLSSNVKLPMNQNYQKLITGRPIADLVNEKYLAKATTITYDMELLSLKVGINGDYTIKSSDDLYSSFDMQEKLLHAYHEYASGKKTLIFNSGIRASQHVLHTFQKAGYPVRHLDNTHSSEERKEILDWFKKTKDAVLTSVSILTTGFDEPGVEVIILNRATRSLALYFQMIGRGSRRLKDKDSFTVIDLGNNVARFGFWTDPVDWQYIFRYPEMFLSSIKDDITIEKLFTYKMPDKVRELFKKTEDVTFDIEKVYKQVLARGQRPKAALEESIDQHARMCVVNGETFSKAKALAKILNDDIESRVKKYVECLSNCSKNYALWLIEDYQNKLIQAIGKKIREEYSE